MNDHLRLYCRKADEMHVFRVAGKYVVCLQDGHRILGANIVAWYSTSDDEVLLPDGVGV